jgi:hypothetical protein
VIWGLKRHHPLAILVLLPVFILDPGEELWLPGMKLAPGAKLVPSSND